MSAKRSSPSVRCRVRTVSFALHESGPQLLSKDAPISASALDNWRSVRDFVPAARRPSSEGPKSFLALWDDGFSRLDDEVECRDRNVVPLDDQDLESDSSACAARIAEARNAALAPPWAAPIGQANRRSIRPERAAADRFSRRLPRLQRVAAPAHQGRCRAGCVLVRGSCLATLWTSAGVTAKTCSRTFR